MIDRGIDLLKAGNFTQAERRLFREMAGEIRHIAGPDGFRDWVRRFVRPLFPHAASVVGIGALSFGRIEFALILGVDCPEEYLKDLHYGAKLGQSQAYLRWSRTRRPLLLHPAADPYCIALDELRCLARHGLGSIAAHGTLDVERRCGSYFNLFGMPEPMGARDVMLLDLLAPALHQAAERLLASRGPGPARPAIMLTATERTVLGLLGRGRSRLEIALALNQSDAIVRSHCETLFAKFGAKNRAEAIRRAIALGLLDAEGGLSNP